MPPIQLPSPYWPDCPADCVSCAEANAHLAAEAARLRESDPAHTEQLVERGMAIVRRLLEKHAP